MCLGSLSLPALQFKKRDILVGKDFPSGFGFFCCFILFVGLFSFLSALIREAETLGIHYVFMATLSQYLYFILPTVSLHLACIFNYPESRALCQ